MPTSISAVIEKAINYSIKLVTNRPDCRLDAVSTQLSKAHERRVIRPNIKTVNRLTADQNLNDNLQTFTWAYNFGGRVQARLVNVSGSLLYVRNVGSRIK